MFCVWARAGVCAKNEVQQTLAVWIAMRCSEHILCVSFFHFPMNRIVAISQDRHGYTDTTVHIENAETDGIL